VLWWIVLGVVVAALLILVLSVRALVVRLPPLGRATVALQRRQADVLALQGSAEALQERVAALQAQALKVAENGQAARIRRAGPG
jgi:hypothetical protein